MGALFHLFNHSIFKSLLFLNAGAVEIVRPVAGRMDLRVEVVERPHLGAVGEEPIGQV